MNEIPADDPLRLCMMRGIAFEALKMSDVDRALVERTRFTAADIARAFAIPRWLIDPTYQPTPEERARWRRRAQKDRWRARYLRRYRRGQR